MGKHFKLWFSGFLEYFHAWGLRVFLGIWVFGYFGVLACATPLDDQVEVYKKAQVQSEAAVANILKTGIQEGRAAEAVAVVKPWLDDNPAASPAAQYYAGLAMQYAGDWQGAVALYRKFLKSKSLDARLAESVVVAVYRLLITDLQERESAYLLMREEGNRLRAYGRAKQFDRWFMREAVSRRDVRALADRLAAIHGNPGENPADYAEFMDALYEELEKFEERDEATVEALDKLARAATRERGFKERWEWVNAVSKYNPEVVQLIASRKDIPKELLDEPLKAARALLAKDPIGGAALVVKGWTRWNYGDTPTFFRFAHAQRELKAEPFIQVLNRLSPQDAKRMLYAGASCPRGRWVLVASFITPDKVQALVDRFPSLLNTIDAPPVELWSADMTVAQAKALAPRIVRNPHEHAALVRAYAEAGTNTVSAVLPVMMKSEGWRFRDAKSLVDAAWNAELDRAGVDHNRMVKDYEAQFKARNAQLKKQTAKEADSNNRMAAFRKLHQDLMSSPSTPGLISLWDAMLVQAPNADKVKMLTKLISDFYAAHLKVSKPRPAAAGQPAGQPSEAEMQDEALKKYLLEQALTKIDFGNPYSRLSFGPDFANGWDRWGHQNVRKEAPELATYLSTLIQQQMKAGKLVEPIFSLWLHCIDPDDSIVKSIWSELVKSPAYAGMDEAYHRQASHDLLFGTSALLGKSENDPHVISRELLELPADALPAQVEAAFKTVVGRVARADEPVAAVGLHKVAALPRLEGDTRSMALALFKDYAPLGDYPARQGYEQLALRLIQDMRNAGQWSVIVPYAAGLWRSADAADDGRRPLVVDELIKFAGDAGEAGQESVALSVARIGLKSRVGSLNANDSSGRNRRNILSQIAGKVSAAVGSSEIPVDETNPAYGIYKSGAEFVNGNLDSAWALYKANENLLQPAAGQGEEQGISLIRKLPVDYCFWLLRRNIDEGRSAQAEVLVKELTIWSRQAEGTFSMEQEAELKIAYADLAFLKGALPTARAWYRKVADAREYRGSEVYLRAALGSVKVDRVSRNFSAALEELDRLMRLKDPSARMRVHYARAEVMMDQENYKDAFDETEAVLRVDPGHADALILRGKLQFEMRKLVEASEIELGVSQENKVMVPGETLKINLNDPTLSVSGVGADIEVEVWAKSGDRERVLLHQLGDSKDKFRAEIPTALAPPVAGDKVLQVLGVDEIRYGYSQRFRSKMKDLPPDPGTVISIASDAHLSFSAGAFPPREGERRLDIEELGLTTAQRKLGLRSVRPGNPVYIRVIDPDQSRTAGIDQLPVSLHTSSGDEIRRLMLKETGPYTGEFEGVVPTAGAQAMAFASESAPGRDPNMTISSKEYPGWMGELGDKEKTRVFGVDLNDNVGFDRMSIRFGDPGNVITRFVLQTSMNGRDWVTRARYPANEAPWDGRPRVSSFPTYGRDALTVSEPKGFDLPADWKENMELTSARASVAYKAQIVKNLSSVKAALADGGHPGYSVIMQYRALFYQPSVAIRKFRLEGYPAVNTVFLIDGMPAGADSEDPMYIERELAPGLHEIQIWRHEGRAELEKRKPVLMRDEAGQDGLVPCPDSLFDPAGFPEGVRAKIEQPAEIIRVDNGLDIAFGDRTQARLTRLVILGFEGVAPEIKSVTLTDRQGVARLPVKEDFMELRKNTQLEVLPGDQITVRYEDPVTATPKRNRHEQRLQVAFNTATISASFLNYKTTEQGRTLELEPIRRFKFGDAVAIVVDDPDMDSSIKPDVVDCQVALSDGTKVAVKAVETEDHSGRFIGRIFPVEGKPARDSEIMVPPGGTLTAVYRDMENLDPGIPADRAVTIEHASYSVPGLEVYNIGSEAMPRAVSGKAAAKAEEKKAGSRAVAEVFEPRRRLDYSHKDGSAADGIGFKAVVGASLRFDVVVPHLALAGSSEISAYVQTGAGRKRAEKPDGVQGMPFDITVPGTFKLTAYPSRAGAEVPAGYSLGASPSPPTRIPPLEEGRFSFSVPLILGDVPLRSYATKEAEALPSSSMPDGVAVLAGDIVYVGFAYKDEKDQVQWKTASFVVESHAFLDVMQSGYSESLESAYVGEKVFLRLVAPGLDAGPDRDFASVALKASSGAQSDFQLRETDFHSGIFKGVFPLSYADDVLPAKLPSIELNGFPVRYGDELTVSYDDQALVVKVNMGADGSIEPFSKRFTGDEMAVKTSFTLAECWFELAKKHRKMDQESLARREMGHAQKLLAEAIAMHRDDEMRAHAEYLLGNLSQEYADLAKNDEAKLPMYQDALARFSKIPVDYPDTEFAPKAQFKTALVYEKMGEMEIAVEEYVKLAYKYPDCEYIPEVMSRLGGYFQSQGQSFKEQADPMRDKTDVESQAEVLRLDDLSYPEFIKAAVIFAKLQQRFPDHELAGLAGLRSAQNYMRANQYPQAIDGFKLVVANDAYDAGDVRAQALYWSGLSYERWAAAMSEGNYKGRGASIQEAYETYRRVTFDFPDSKWAKYARGRLADPVFGRIIETEEKAREVLLEALKYQKIKRSQESSQKKVMDKLLNR